MTDEQALHIVQCVEANISRDIVRLTVCCDHYADRADEDGSPYDTIYDAREQLQEILYLLAKTSTR